MALSTSALRHPDGSRRWAGGGVSRQGGRSEGRGSRQVKADRGGLRGRAPKSISTIVWLMYKQHATAADGSHP